MELVIAAWVSTACLPGLQEDTTELADPLEELLAGNISTVEFSHGFVVVNAPRRGRVYMSGSFNPLHEGHRGMLAAGLAARSKKAHSGEVSGDRTGLTCSTGLLKRPCGCAVIHVRQHEPLQKGSGECWLPVATHSTTVLSDKRAGLEWHAQIVDPTTDACWPRSSTYKQRHLTPVLLLGLQDALHALSIGDSFNSYTRAFASPLLLLSTSRHPEQSKLCHASVSLLLCLAASTCHMCTAQKR